MISQTMRRRRVTNGLGLNKIVGLDLLALLRIYFQRRFGPGSGFCAFLRPVSSMIMYGMEKYRSAASQNCLFRKYQ